MQMEQQRKRRILDHEERRLYYHKPHFGPEETEELADVMRQRRIDEKEKQKINILNQIKLN